MVPAAVVHKVPAAVHKVLDSDSLLHIVVVVPAAAARREHNRLPEVLDHKVLGHNPDFGLVGNLPAAMVVCRTLSLLCVFFVVL